MVLHQLLKKEIKEPLQPIVWFLLLTSLSNALLLNIINTTASDVINEELTTQHFLLCFLYFLVVLFLKKTASKIK